jgi:hypothetical protein
MMFFALRAAWPVLTLRPVALSLAARYSVSVMGILRAIVSSPFIVSSWTGRIEHWPVG